MSDQNFAVRYGPWAVIAGASDGIGAAIARALAHRGLHLVLLARRAPLLDALARELTIETGVDVRTLAVDLGEADASDRIASLTADVEVGLLVCCAGADPNYSAFLDRPVDDAVAMVRRNCETPMRLSHHFAAPMVDRGQGGIVLLGSGAALAGGPNMVAYGASKAFDLVFGEALWAELHGSGVDVLNLVLGLTDTPSMRQVLVKRGVIAEGGDDESIPMAGSPEDVARDLIDQIGNGPTYFSGDMAKMADQMMRSMSRNDAVRRMIASSSGIMNAAEGDRR